MTPEASSSVASACSIKRPRNSVKLVEEQDTVVREGS
jgi:hypothetical protein